jgi:hypothetical protein
MSWKRLARIGCLLVSNGTILFFAVRLLLAFGADTASEARIDRLLGGPFRFLVSSRICCGTYASPVGTKN